MEEFEGVREEGRRRRRRVCVTGASGYLASWLIKRLLLSGRYHVTGTVRDPGDDEKLAHLWGLQGADQRLRLVKADLMVEGSFDEAINGCDGVFHMASPVLFTNVSDPQVQILAPAVEGTLNVLRSCKKNPSLRRVVLTSSSSAARIRNDLDINVPLDESSWSSVQLCQELKRWYALSKTLAERAAWEFCKTNSIDLVTVLPGFVIGPSLPRNLCQTASDVLHLLQGETGNFDAYGNMPYVDIDDVALSHILVYEHENAHGRYFCVSATLDSHEIVSMLSARYPDLPTLQRFEKLGKQCYNFDTTKLTSLGIKFKSIEEMFDDCIASLRTQGHLPRIKMP